MGEIRDRDPSDQDGVGLHGFGMLLLSKMLLTSDDEERHLFLEVV